MEIIFIVIVAGVAVWYLYRTFARSLKAGSPSCGCGGCSHCSAGNSASKAKERGTPPEFSVVGKRKNEHQDSKSKRKEP